MGNAIEAMRQRVVDNRWSTQNTVVRQTSVALDRLASHTDMRVGNVLAEAVVTTVKNTQIAHVARHAMTNDAMLQTFVGVLAGDNAIKYENLQAYVAFARSAMIQGLLDMGDNYCREGMR